MTIAITSASTLTEKPTKLSIGSALGTACTSSSSSSSRMRMRATSRSPSVPASTSAGSRRSAAKLPELILAGVGRPFVSGLAVSPSAASLGQQQAEAPGERLLQLAPVDHHVEHAVLKQELGALEARGQLLPDRLLDHARTREADQRARLGHVEIAEHRERSRDAAGGGVGQHAHEGQPRLVEQGQR